MSQLHQMQVTYAPVEDRLLFRVNTRQRQEFRFWMTRRYVALLWKTILDHLRTTHEEGGAAEGQNDEAEIPKSKKKKTPEPLKDAIIAKEHEEQVAKSDFKTQYQESTYLPLGEQPLLLFGIGIKKGGPDQNQSILCMHPPKGEGIEISLNDQITHSLCRLVADATKKADWGLDLEFSQASKYFPGKGEGPGLN
ncbi:MAG: hypothetical protein KDN19_13380 [Verrucomicrobiae bacterium]|nr:hypothetical protein [Verrucomicrobiae bacterium]